MTGLQEFCLRWNNHGGVLTCIFDEVLKSELFYDCTLVAEGRSIDVHRILLSACSQYFKDILSHHRKKDPIIILKDVTFRELSVLVDYMYRGEVNIRENELQDILKVAESLKIKGLSDSTEKTPPVNVEESRPQKRPILPPSTFPQRHSTYKGDTHGNDSLNHGNESSVSAKRMRRCRPSSEESGLGQTQTPQESLTASTNISQSTVNHQPSPATLSTTVIPMPTSAAEVLDQFLPEPVTEPKPKTELLEPKQEIEDINGSDNYEDLTLDDDDDDNSMHMDNSQPGPSMGSESSNGHVGMPPWQVGADTSVNQEVHTQDATADSQVFQKIAVQSPYIIKHVT